jgi:hypothetical protein
MLEGVHRARIDVDIRVKFLKGHRESPAFEKGADGCRSESLAKRRKDAAGHKNKFGPFGIVWCFHVGTIATEAGF